MGEFEDRMFQQSQANPLGGFVTAGAAKLMADRTVATTKTLDRLNESLKMLDGEPKPAFEQMEDLKGDATAQEEMASIEEQSANYLAFQQNVMNQEKLYGNVFDDALGKLAIIGGEEANALSKSLGVRKADMQVQYDTIRELPADQMKYASQILNHDMTKAQHLEYMNNAALQSDIRSAIGSLSPELYKLIPAGKVKYFSADKYQQYVQDQDKLLDHFRSLGYSDEVSYGAIRQATAARGGDVSYSDSIEANAKFHNINKLDPVQQNTLQSMRTQHTLYTATWHSLSQDMKDAIEARDQGKTLNPWDADVDKEKFKAFENELDVMYNIFGLNGNIDKTTGQPYGGHYIQNYQGLLNSDPELLEVLGRKDSTPQTGYWVNSDIPDGIGTSPGYLKHSGALSLYNKRISNIERGEEVDATGIEGEGFNFGSFDWLNVKSDVDIELESRLTKAVPSPKVVKAHAPVKPVPKKTQKEIDTKTKQSLLNIGSN